MKSIKQVLFCALFVSACGSDSQRGVDPMSLVQQGMPKLPVAQIADVQSPVVEQPKHELTAALAIPTKLDDCLAQGRALVAKGDLANAKLMFEAATKLDKKRAEPHIELAKLYITKGDRGLAMASANKAVKLAPLSSQAWNTKGRAELNRFAYDDAIEAFSKAVEINADNVWAWNNLGYTELQLKKYDEAVEHLTQATSKKDATGFMFNNLGTALEHLDRLDDARDAFEAGGKLGSSQALASRKRLEGVESIAIVDTGEKPDVKPDVTHTFDNSEGPMVPDTDDTTGDDSTDTGDEETKPEPTAAPVDVQPAAVEAPKAIETAPVAPVAPVAPTTETASDAGVQVTI
ncbi:MAG: tetratricopeptide repeat protein [Kofleriaceae bacterium]